MKISITANDLRKSSKKMNKEELQEHIKNSRQGVGVQKSKKAYSRKQKYTGGY